ncbi:CRTAC1 family protein [bacterium]|nr:CRTAC1 family protein [bacterium]MDB4541161.1 CRTAC1 family protein [Akkermansiaceae bacterium]
MRTDPNKDKDFVYSKAWESSGRLKFYDTDKEGKRVSNSFSGNERDNLYLNRKGKSFTKVSALSGLDLVSDGRSFAYLDYDQDGWLDIAVASANAPQLQLLRNEIGNLTSEPSHQVTLKFFGSNQGNKPSPTLSNRDGYGAKITATLASGLVIYREHLCGTGMAAQNSNKMHLGLGASSSIEKLVVGWPSGKTQTIQNIPAGTTREIREENE